MSAKERVVNEVHSVQEDSSMEIAKANDLSCVVEE
jgi:hypothetical protein